MSRETVQALTQLYRLANCQRAKRDPVVALRQILPVPWFYRFKRILLEVEIRMSGRQHFVVDILLGITQMAAQTPLAAFDQVARVVHPVLMNGLLIGPGAGRVIAQPLGGRSMAAFTADAVRIVVKRFRLLTRRNKGCVTCQALRGRLRIEMEYPRHILPGNGTCQDSEGTRVLSFEIQVLYSFCNTDV